MGPIEEGDLQVIDL